MTSRLFEPIQLARLTLSNRIIVSPMCQYSASSDGVATSWHTIHLGHLALSGAALIFLEATAVEAAGRITPHDLGLYSDACEEGLAAVLAAVRANSDIPIGIQIGHAGRKASHHVPWEGGTQIPMAEGGWLTFAPSELPYQPGSEASAALDTSGLAWVKEAFRLTAQRALRLGLAAIEVHAAHGYLLHEFLSPLSNKREDQYGGSLANRMRFPLEVFDTVRAVAPQIPVGIRVSATDYFDGGWDLEQTIAFAQELKKHGCDFIDVSGGGLTPAQKINVGPGYQVPYAEAVKRETGMPTIAVGLITDYEQAEQIVATGQADMTALGRAMLYDARWPWHAAAKLGAKVRAPRQYLRSPPHGVNNLFLAN